MAPTEAETNDLFNGLRENKSQPGLKSPSTTPLEWGEIKAFWIKTQRTLVAKRSLLKELLKNLLLEDGK